MKSNVYVAEICGLCYGSKLAIDKTTQALYKNKNVVIYKEILHNKNVMNKLKENGALLKNEFLRCKN